MPNKKAKQPPFKLKSAFPYYYYYYHYSTGHRLGGALASNGRKMSWNDLEKAETENIRGAGCMSSVR